MPGRRRRLRPDKKLCSSLMHPSLRRVTKLSDLDGRRERLGRRRKTEKRDDRWPGDTLPFPFPDGIARASRQEYTRVRACVRTCVRACVRLHNEMRGCRIGIIHREQWVWRHELRPTNCRSVCENLRDFVSYPITALWTERGEETRGSSINPQCGISFRGKSHPQLR